jgi:ribosomal peptide maturation radical SAM protein 1
MSALTKFSNQSAMKSPQVMLINMPWGRIDRPSIQLGILQSVLACAGIRVEVRSFNLAFVDYLLAATANLPVQDRISLNDYCEFGENEGRVGLAEWIFAVAPFQDSSERDEQYLNYVGSTKTREELLAKAMRMRSLVQPFLKFCVENVLATGPRIVGFTSTFSQNVPSLVLAKLLKSRHPSIHIVFGGSNCDGPMGEALHRAFPWVDTVVRGEAERVLPQLIKDLSTGGIRPQPGLCYRENGQRLVVDQKGGDIPMDEVPLPNYDEFFERLSQSGSRAEILPHLVIPFESARGCWWGAKKHCTFCGLNGSSMAFRSKSPSLVVEELLALARKYGQLNFMAVDNIMDMSYLRDLLPKLRDSGYDFTLFYEAKANLKKEHLWAMREAGIVAFQPGIESFSTPILKLMDKGVTALQNIRLLKWCAELGIHATWNLIYGFPHEPIEEYVRMTDLVKSLTHLRPPEYFSVLGLERFSPYFERPNEFGLRIVGPRRFYRLIYSCDESTLSDLAYDFDYAHDDGRNPNLYVAELKERIEYWQKEFHAERFLEYRRGPGFLMIRDLDKYDYSLAETEAKIYLACDEGETAMEVWKNLRADGETGVSPNEVEDFLDEMTKARLMYKEDNLYLSLAVPMKPRLNKDCSAAPVESKARFVELTRQVLEAAPATESRFREA